MSFSVKINGLDYTRWAVYPITFQQVLDDALDQGYFELRNIEIRNRKQPEVTIYKLNKPIKPFSKVVITYDENEEPITMLVASDDVTYYNARGHYTHKILLVEETKALERVICSAKSFVKPLITDYASGLTDKYAVANMTDFGYLYVASTPIFNSWKLETERLVLQTNSIKLIYVIPTDESTSSVTIPPIISFKSQSPIGIYNTDEEKLNFAVNDIILRVINEQDGSTVANYIGRKNSVGTYSGAFDQHTIQLSPGSYSVNAAVYTGFTSNPSVDYVNVRFDFAVVKAYEEPKALTITRVVNELLDVSELIKIGETPRYKFNEADALLYENTPCAELSFANGSTLRENLTEIAGLVHCIPRLKGDTIYFIKLGQNEYADMSEWGGQISHTMSQNAEKFASELDSIVNGLMNIDNQYQGSISDPYMNIFKTLRSETSNVDTRTTVDTAIIKTVCGIEKITSAKCYYKGAVYDITKFIYEKKEYDLLDSNNGAYPYSKAYALYYVQEQPNIYGLNYKEDNPVSSVFENYAIENILNLLGANISVLENTNYLDLAFNIQYVAGISGRVRQSKVNTEDLLVNSVIAYNQNANKVSSINYGKRLKGQVAMYGSDTITRCYKTRTIRPFINVAGKLYNEDNASIYLRYGGNYYINQVTSKIWKEYCTTELVMSKNFNQMGRYTGINSAIRQFEIDTNVQERYLIYEDYVIFGKLDNTSLDKTSQSTLDIYEKFKESIKAIITNTTSVTEKVSLAYVTTYENEYGGKIAAQSLPVQSLAFGNSLIFNFKYKDNYSAGDFVIDVSGATGSSSNYSQVKYKLTRESRYGDPIYGEAHSMNWTLFQNVSYIPDKGTVPDIGDKIPNVNIYGTISDNSDIQGEIAFTTPRGFIIHKSSRDQINFTYQINFVTNDNLIIGEALTQRNFMAGGTPLDDRTITMKFFSTRLNEMTGDADQSTSVYSTSVLWESDSNGDYVRAETVPEQGTYKSWGIFNSAGEFLLGKNTTEYEKTYIFQRHNFEEE